MVACHQAFGDHLLLGAITRSSSRRRDDACALRRRPCPRACGRIARRTGIMRRPSPLAFSRMFAVCMPPGAAEAPHDQTLANLMSEDDGLPGQGDGLTLRTVHPHPCDVPAGWVRFRRLHASAVTDARVLARSTARRHPVSSLRTQGATQRSPFLPAPPPRRFDIAAIPGGCAFRDGLDADANDAPPLFFLRRAPPGVLDVARWTTLLDGMGHAPSRCTHLRSAACVATCSSVH